MINAQYFDELADQVRLCNGCAELQCVVNQAFAPLQAQYAAILQQLTALAGFEVLLSVSDPVTWIENFITAFIGPQYQAYLAYVEQVTQLTEAVANLTSAIETAASSFTDCHITVPPLT